jgi:hypothetical protein
VGFHGTRDGSGPDRGGGIRAEIREFTKASRLRLVRRMATTTFGESSRPFMVTLTYPGVPLDGHACYRQLVRLYQALERWHGRTCPRSSDLRSLPPDCPEPARAAALGVFWKREFQRRGSLHFHLALEFTCGCHVPQGELRPAVAGIWHRIAGDGNPDHLRAGTQVAAARGDMAWYFSGYAAKSKDYQHAAPEGFGNLGRWWGVLGSIVVLDPHTVRVRPDVAIASRRILERIKRSHTRKRGRYRARRGSGFMLVTRRRGGLVLADLLRAAVGAVDGRERSRGPTPDRMDVQRAPRRPLTAQLPT